MKRLLFLPLLLLLCLWAAVGSVAAAPATVVESPQLDHPVAALTGEELTYDIAFLWFDRLAEGKISLQAGEEPGTYLAILEARTLGLAAFLTRHRVERFETLMEIGPDGLLRPLYQRSHTIKGEGTERREKITSYQFDYQNRNVLYQKRKTGGVEREEFLPLATEGPVYDILSAFYNLRSGLLGPVERGRHVELPTFSRKGTEEIVVARVVEQEQKRHPFFPEESILCKVLVDPQTFGTKGRDLLVGFNLQLQPQRAVVKNVVGLGDVRGTLRSAVAPPAVTD